MRTPKDQYRARQKVRTQRGQADATEATTLRSRQNEVSELQLGSFVESGAAQNGVKGKMRFAMLRKNTGAPHSVWQVQEYLFRRGVRPSPASSQGSKKGMFWVGRE